MCACSATRAAYFMLHSHLKYGSAVLLRNTTLLYYMIIILYTEAQYIYIYYIYIYIYIYYTDKQNMKYAPAVRRVPHDVGHQPGPRHKDPQRRRTQPQNGD